MPKKLANELWLNMVVQTRLFKQIKDSQKAQPGTLYFHNYVAQVVPININNFDWYTHVDFEVHANDCKQVGSGCTFKVRVNVDVSIDVRLPFKLDLLENVRIVDDITFVEGNGHLILVNFSCKVCGLQQILHHRMILKQLIQVINVYGVQRQEMTKTKNFM